MATKYIKHQGGSAFAVNILTGAVLSILTGAFLVMITAAVMVKGAIPQTSSTYILYIILFVSTFLGSVYCCHRAEGKYAIISFGNIAICLFALIATNIIFFHGEFNKLWISLIVTIASGASSCCIASTGKRPKKRRKGVI